jgi:antirestriction protein ArdC
LRRNGVAYRGINALILFIEFDIKGYCSSHWMTFAQIQALGGCVRKGEK